MRRNFNVSLRIIARFALYRQKSVVAYVAQCGNVAFPIDFSLPERNFLESVASVQLFDSADGNRVINFRRVVFFSALFRLSREYGLYNP